MPPHDFDDNMWDRGWNKIPEQKKVVEKQDEIIVAGEDLTEDNIELEIQPDTRGKERE